MPREDAPPPATTTQSHQMRPRMPKRRARRSDTRPDRGREKKFIMPKMAARLAALVMPKPKLFSKKGASALSRVSCGAIFSYQHRLISTSASGIDSTQQNTHPLLLNTTRKAPASLWTSIQQQ